MTKNSILTNRINKTPTSFVREILKVTQNPDTISFAGGLPNPISFPQSELATSMQNIVELYGSKIFQYSTTQGLYKLRKWIASRYSSKFSLAISPDDIVITSGSQQSLDLIGKVLIEKEDKIIIEKPSYLGAIQAFSQYEPTFMPIELNEQGININEIKNTLENNKCKLAYIIPNFQNPTGIVYSSDTRNQLRKLFSNYDTILVEDDPYGELTFDDCKFDYIGDGSIENSILLGTFSKTLSPGIRLGFMITKNEEIRTAIIKGKQASDLHSNIFCQYMIYDYLTNNDYDAHISKIRQLYNCQSQCMIEAMEKYFPSEITFTKPYGGMFIWVTLPSSISAMKVFEKAIIEKVAFVPGNPFYIDEDNANTLRLNYTNSSNEAIDEGIKRLGNVLNEFIFS